MKSASPDGKLEAAYSSETKLLTEPKKTQADRYLHSWVFLKALLCRRSHKVMSLSDFRVVLQVLCAFRQALKGKNTDHMHGSGNIAYLTWHTWVSP